MLDVLRDPSLKPESTNKVKIRAMAEKMFDFSELSKRTPAQNWSRLSPEQQNEFIQLYESIVEGAYSSKIMPILIKIIFSKEVSLTEKLSRFIAW